MVDAINAINSATRSVAQERKDWTIDWYKLTARQVIDYANKGEDVPPDVLRWAEDYAKLTNVPDDVSYEAVNGSVEADEARSTEENESLAEDAVPSGESTGEDSTDVGTPTTLSLYDRTGFYIQESGERKSEIEDAASDAGVRIGQSREVAKNAEQQSKMIEEITKSKKSEYDELSRKLSGDNSKITPQDLRKLDSLSGELISTGKSIQANFAIYDAQLQEIESVFAEYETLPSVADSKGRETAEAGFQLMSGNEEHIADVHERADKIHARKFGSLLFDSPAATAFYDMLLDRDYSRGMHAVSSGSGAIASAANGEAELNNVSSVNNDSKNTLIESMQKVEDITMVKSENVNADIAEDEFLASSESENDDKTNTIETEKRTENGVVKDSALLVDDIELHRRKVNRGEIPS